MLKKCSAALAALILTTFAVACGTSHTETTNANSAASQTASAAAEGLRMGPDNSEILTEREADVVIETRTFKDPNSRIEKVVVTNRGGKRTARVYYRNREVRDLPDNKVEQALSATGDTLVSFGGEVADKTEDVGKGVADKAEDVAGEVGDKAEDVGGAAKKGVREVGDKAEDVGDKAKSAGGKVADKTKDGVKEAGKGVKKAGDKVKDAVTP